MQAKDIITSPKNYVRAADPRKSLEGAVEELLSEVITDRRTVLPGRRLHYTLWRNSGPFTGRASALGTLRQFLMTVPFPTTIKRKKGL